MAFEELLEVKNIIKFVVLFIPLTLFIFFYAPDIKWKLLLTFGAFIGLATALGGGAIGRKH